jgi:hypothetical protein
MITAAISTRTLNGEEIGNSLDDTNLSIFPLLVPTNGAGFILG